VAEQFPEIVKRFPILYSKYLFSIKVILV